ncbi:MAG: hypothetical protein JSV25_06075 [Spirochaetota bacterium]|nr:MAG: hypothetical protein JSV25_06075 [Spirochaetota bacterium]
MRLAISEIRKIILLIFILFFFIYPGIILAQTEFIGRSEIQHLQWGGTENGWDRIHTLRDLRINRGPNGRLDLVLEDNSPPGGDHIDLLLHFDKSTKDSIGVDPENYKIREINIFPSASVKKFGEKSAAFFHHMNTIVISPAQGSLFLEDPLQSFTIDFFLFPTSVRDGGSVLSWHAPSLESEGFSGVKATLTDGKLIWTFEEVFRKANGSYVNVMVRELELTPLNEWHHHAIHYDYESGLMTLYFDGRETGLIWLTEDGTEDSNLLEGAFSPYLKAPMIIGDQYLGYIDEFRVSRGFPKLYIDNYRNYGEMRSEVIELPSKATKLVKVSWESVEDNGTAVRVYCRLSENYFLPGALDELNDRESPSWMPVKNGIALEKASLKGKYLQWKAEFFGTKGSYTPHLMALDISLELDPPPTAPTLIEAVSLDGGIRLLWIKNKEPDIKGYKVYYGTQSKYYFGKGAESGDSPVFTGNIETFELSGLENERVYFVTITAVDDENQESGFSKEFIARPSSIFSSD